MGKQEKSRMVHFDVLRIIACFSVVMLHSAAQSWYSVPVREPSWLIANSYDAAFRFGVPVFVMISGALFLGEGKEVSVKKLYTHNILRLLILYFVWATAYGLFDCRGVEKEFMNWDTISREIMENRYHLWYLPMIIGIYMLLPILQKWLKQADRKDVEYFLLLFLICQIGKETLQALSKRQVIGFVGNMIQVYMVCGYLGYFVLGYYLVKFDIPGKWNKWIYGAGVIGVVANIGLGNWLSLRADRPLGEIYDSFGFFTFCISLALFMFAKNVLGKIKYSAFAEKLIKELSLCTLGIYVMHVGMIEILATKGIHSTMVTPIVGIPMLALLCFVGSGFIAAILRRIPVVGRYIC